MNGRGMAMYPEDTEGGASDDLEEVGLRPSGVAVL
jgi:hypothetical protein